jgi:hypothetical protein
MQIMISFMLRLLAFLKTGVNLLVNEQQLNVLISASFMQIAVAPPLLLYPCISAFFCLENYHL